ncbi:MAG: hypothetical protein Q9P01_16455 [Anaerolineae bacterium]|nr:hypothetical protein [Anaerolineae bacterium]MDQ7036357.1 hypothetical protein [Anaerolineae bacterium]
MQQPKKNSLIVQIIATTIQFGIVGLLATLPLAFIIALIFNASIGGEIWLLGAALVGSYFPIRSLIGSILHGTGNVNYIPAHLNLPLLLLGAMAFVIASPILWMATFFPMIIGLIIYAYFGQSLLLALLVSMTIQIISAYRQVKQSPQTGMSNIFTVNLSDLSQRMGQDTIIMDSDNLHPIEAETIEAEIDDEADVIYHLPERTSTAYNLPQDDEEIIIIYPDVSNEQSQQD